VDREELAVELQKLIREIQRGFRPHPKTLTLRPGEMRALWIVARHGPLRKSDLADILGISKPLVSSLARTLENLGLITQSVPERDHRRRVIALSEKGQHVLDEMRALRQERMTALFERLTEEEQEMLYHLLQKLREPGEEEAEPRQRMR
jgi:DNA-binding MarR family transcriptional regulator